MKKGDPGFKRLARNFRSFYCGHIFDLITARPLKDGCPHRVRITMSYKEEPECTHQPGWHCTNPKNPGNIKLEDLVVEEL